MLCREAPMRITVHQLVRHPFFSHDGKPSLELAVRHWKEGRIFETLQFVKNTSGLESIGSESFNSCPSSPRLSIASSTTSPGKPVLRLKDTTDRSGRRSVDFDSMVRYSLASPTLSQQRGGVDWGDLSGTMLDVNGGD
eukprot:PhM_4_TR3473/c0_g1_i1/m.46663